MKVLPSSGAETTLTRPSWLSTMVRTIESPGPEPWMARSCTTVERKKRPKTASWSAGEHLGADDGGPRWKPVCPAPGGLDHVAAPEVSW